MICERTRIWTDPSILRVVHAAPPPAPTVSADGVISFAPQRRRRPDNPFEKYHATIRADLPAINLRQRSADAAARVEAWIRDYEAGTPYTEVQLASGVGRGLFAARIKWYMTTDFHALLIRPRAPRLRPRAWKMKLRTFPPLDPKTAAAVARSEKAIRLLRTRTAASVAKTLGITKTRLYQIIEWYRTLTPKACPVRPKPPKPAPKRRGRKLKPCLLTPADRVAYRAMNETLTTLSRKYGVSISTVARWIALEPLPEMTGNVHLIDVL